MTMRHAQRRWRRAALWAALLALGLGGAWARAPWAQTRPTADASPVHVIRIENQVINPVVLRYIEKGIARAERDGATCLIVELDTPGGVLETTRLIVKAFMASDVPIVVYVSPSGARAASAGVFITMAANVAAMAPSTNIGAAHPVSLGGGDNLRKIVEREGPHPADATTSATTATQGRQPTVVTKDVMSEKIVNDTVAWIDGIARMRGRNATWARRAVVESISTTETEALRLDVIDLIAVDLNDLLSQLDGREVTFGAMTHTLRTRGAAVESFPMSGLERFLMVVTHPEVALLLMMLGTLGLIFEFTHPGIGFPGIAGAVSLLLGLYAMQMLPVNYLALAMLGLGILLLIAEVLATTHGLLALGGLVCLTLGSLFLIESPDETMRIPLTTVLATVATTALIVLFIGHRAVMSFRSSVTTGAEGLIGTLGSALSDLAPEGAVFVHGERWRAGSAAPIRAGQSVRVVAVQGLYLTVEPANPTPSGTKG
jgi:membrane-bound serine protease (ClpP class)